MLIVSQDRESTSENLNLYIIEEDGNFIIESAYCCLGKYKTKERAKEILVELANWYSMADKTDVTFEEGLLNILSRRIGVFYMPED